MICAANEFLHFTAPSGSSCGEYLEPYISAAGGYLVSDNATQCQFCAIDNTNTFLSLVSISFSNRWRDFGILFAYMIFNVFAAVVIYWLARVPKGKKYAGKGQDSDLGLVRTKSRADGDGHVDGVAEKTGDFARPAKDHVVDDSDLDNDGANGTIEEQVVQEKKEVVDTKSQGTNGQAVAGAAASEERPAPERFITAKEF